MSFGFSVGDLIGAANLTYHLIRALQGSHDAGDEYRAAIHELGCMQQAFMRVSFLGSSSNTCNATFQSASFIVMGAMDIIKSFLDKTKKYDRRLGGLKSSGLAQNMRKVGWILYKADDMKRLRETLHARLSTLSVLLVAANIEPDGDGSISNHVNSNNSALFHQDEILQPPTRQAHAKFRVSHTSAARLSQSIDSEVDSQRPPMKLDGQPQVPEPMAQYQSGSESPGSKVFALPALSQTELMSVLTDTPTRSARIEEVAELLRTLVPLGECQLHPEECGKLLDILNKICGERERVYNHVPTLKLPIKFKDAVGRKFSFPWHLCQSWKGMEELINQAFQHEDNLGPHVHEGHYDLIGPDGEIILPQVWDTVVQPDWAITMHMWPMPEPPQSPDQLPPDRVPQFIAHPLLPLQSAPLAIASTAIAQDTEYSEEN